MNRHQSMFIISAVTTTALTIVIWGLCPLHWLIKCLFSIPSLIMFVGVCLTICKERQHDHGNKRQQ